MSIRTRLLLIAGLIALSVFYLIPRNVTLRERDVETGVMRDTVMTRVPLKLGLDLQGGMHLALELDQSKQVSADPERDLDLALTVLRKRIDEFGVAEPVIQKVGERADRRRARRHRPIRPGPRPSCSAAPSWSSGSPTRPGRWRRRFPRWTGRSGSLGVKRRRHDQHSRPRCSSCWVAIPLRSRPRATAPSATPARRRTPPR